MTWVRITCAERYEMRNRFPVEHAVEWDYRQPWSLADRYPPEWSPRSRALAEPPWELSWFSGRPGWRDYEDKWRHPGVRDERKMFWTADPFAEPDSMLGMWHTVHYVVWRQCGDEVRDGWLGSHDPRPFACRHYRWDESGCGTRRDLPIAKGHAMTDNERTAP
jgi:hypothetical protein